MRISSRIALFKNVSIVIGVIFILAGSALLGVSYAMYMDGLYFRRNGVRTEAVIEKIRHDDIWIRYSTGKNTFTSLLVCQSLMPDGSIREFLSWHLWYDPTGSFLSDSVTVFLDPNDDSQYYMDLFSVLPDGDDEASGIGEDL